MKLKTILFAMGTLTLLASCGGNPPASSGSSHATGLTSESTPATGLTSDPAGSGPTQDMYNDSTKIVVWADKSEHETIITLVNEYNKQSNTTVKVNVTLKAVSEADAGTELLKDAKGKDYPSLFAVADDQLSALLDKKTLASLPNSYQDAVRNNDSETAIASVEYDGKIVAFPVQADNGYFLYYDGDVVTDAQASKLESLIEVANRENLSILYDIGNGWYANSMFHADGVCGKDSLAWKKNEEGKVIYDITWDSEKAAVAAEYFSNLVKPEYDDKTMIVGSNAELEGGFKDGTMCAGISGTWEYDILKGFCPNLKARRLPTFTDRNGEHQMGSFTGSKVYAVNAFATSDEQKAALLLGNYLTTKNAQLLRYENRGALPCNKEAVADSRYADHVTIAAAALQDQNRFAAIQAKATEGRYWDVGASIGKSLMTGEKGAGNDWAAFLKAQCDTLRTPQAD